MTFQQVQAPEPAELTLTLDDIPCNNLQIHNAHFGERNMKITAFAKCCVVVLLASGLSGFKSAEECRADIVC